MKTSIYVKTMFFLGLAGFLFSGYLSAIKFLTSTCAFNEPCPYFLGHPACWYGFGMFSIIFISAIFGFSKTIHKITIAKVIATVSALGILFAGYFTIPEIEKFLSKINTGYTLVLPTCAFGFIFYVLIFIFSVWYLSTNKSSEE